MPKQKQPPRSLPLFRDEAEERRFWETHDTADYLEWTSARPVVFPDLKPGTTTISLRLPSHLLAELKRLANRRDIPYQSLLKVFLAERIAAESATAPPAARRKSGAIAPRRMRIAAGVEHFDSASRSRPVAKRR